MVKVFFMGMIFFFTSACLPHISLLPQKALLDLQATQEESPSLFTQSELDEIFPQEAPSPSSEGSASSSMEIGNKRLAGTLELPIREESNDDFSLEFFPGERPRNGRDFDIPIVINAQVEQFIQYFQTTLRNHFTNWLARSEKYIPFMKNLLKESGLPEDLVYLALIESGFNPHAYSRMKASGPWQFIYLTGKRYGLKVNWWVDERRDPEKSTIAAAKYLKDLYDMFECWYLAAAGYNAGEKKIANAIKRYRTEDFWELSKYQYLKRETKNYVPQMIAAALIAKDPEMYGFTGIEYQEALQYEKVSVPEAVDLRLIAKACEISVEELKELNPELLRWCTPPDTSGYEIKIPQGKRDLFLKNFENLLPSQKIRYKIHIVNRGDTLTGIAKHYRVDVEPLLELNRLKKGSRLSVGTNLLIPTPQDAKLAVSEKKGPQGRNQNPKSDETTYTIQPGDCLWSIANELGVNIGALSRWNNIHPDRKLQPGDKLKIKMTHVPTSSDEPPKRSGKKEMIYIVKVGDTLWSIAKRYNLTISEIKSWNDLNGGDRIQPADRLILRLGGIRSSTLN